MNSILGVKSREYIQLNVQDINDQKDVDIKISIDCDYVVINNFIYTSNDAEDKVCFNILGTPDGKTVFNMGSGSTLQGNTQFNVGYIYKRTEFVNATWTLLVSGTDGASLYLKGDVIFNIEAIKLNSI